MPDAVPIPSTDADVDAEGDPFLRLLTDALMAGPGSAEWATAVEQARGRGVDEAGELSLLLVARERLGQGRAYRSVRAGPGFGRRIMSKVDADLAARPKGPLSPGLLAYAGIGAAVAAVGVLMAVLFRSGSGIGGSTGELAGTYFTRPFASATLTDPRPSGWRRIGSLPLDDTNRLTLEPAFALGADYLGGGLVTGRPIPADDPLSVQASFRFGHVGPGCVPQLFVSDVDQFSGDRGMSLHELAWLVQDGQGQVATADGRVAGPRLKVPDKDDVAVKVVVSSDGDAAVVCNGQVLWTGDSGLAADKPRFAGVRLLFRGPGHHDAVAVSGLKVLQK